jgi:hypothetical protein
MNPRDITTCMSKMACVRPVFHSEADFQHELAMELDRSGYGVRLEVPHSIAINGASLGAELDILVIEPKTRRRTAIELKYVTAQKTVVHAGETFNLCKNWGTNFSRFDCWADFQRVGGIVAAGHAHCGFAVFLTNAEDAWHVDAGPTATMARQFSIHDNRNVAAGAVLDWAPIRPTVGSVSKKRLPPYSPITVPTPTVCTWTDYSALPGPNGRFRFLFLAI